MQVALVEKEAYLSQHYRWTQIEDRGGSYFEDEGLQWSSEEEVGCGVSHQWTINVCPTVTNHYAEFQPWRRDLTFKTRPPTPVRRLVLPL
ncbi:hypothetical protein AOLI_G00202490 [Acnodon oligacanthus]